MVLNIARLLVRCLPGRLAVRLVRALSARSQRPSVLPSQQQALEQAVEMRYGPGDKNVAWVWGKGPLVIFVHGWNGRAAQLAPLALETARLGFRCVAMEVTGHGSSPGSTTGWSCFLEDIVTLSRSLGEEVHAYVGHSAGALTMMAVRAPLTPGSRYVCICAPSHPYPPIHVVRHKLNPGAGVIARYKDGIAAQFNASWMQLESGAAYAGAGRNLLLFYDESDRFVSHEEGDKILAWCPGARLIKTRGYSHSKILAAPELVQAVTAFLGEEQISL